MTNIVSALFLTVGLAVTLGFTFVHYQNKEWKRAIYWACGSGLCAAIGLIAISYDGRGEADSNRPWVGIEAVGAIAIESTKPVGVEINFVNTGRTPALNLEAEFIGDNYKGIPKAPPIEVVPIPRRAPFSSRTTLNPGQTLVGHASTAHPPSGLVLIGYTTGEYSFIAWGTVKYEDSSGRHYANHFCAFYNAKVAPFGLTPCETGND